MHEEQLQMKKDLQIETGVTALCGDCRQGQRPACHWHVPVIVLISLNLQLSAELEQLRLERLMDNVLLSKRDISLFHRGSRHDDEDAD